MGLEYRDDAVRGHGVDDSAFHVVGGFRLADDRVQRHDIGHVLGGDLPDVLLDDIGFHLLEGEAVEEDVEWARDVADPPIRQGCGTFEVDRATVGEGVIEDRDTIAEQRTEVVGSDRRQWRQVEVDIAGVRVPAHDDLAEYAVAAADLQEPLRRGVHLARQGCEAQEVVEVRPGPARAGRSHQPEHLGWLADLALADAFEIGRPACVIPGQPRRVEVTSRLVCTAQRRGEPWLLDGRVDLRRELEGPVHHRAREPVPIGRVEQAPRGGPGFEPLEPDRPHVVHERADDGLPEVRGPVDRIAGLDPVEGALGKGIPVDHWALFDQSRDVTVSTR